jgi:hypothetical protein
MRRLRSKTAYGAAALILALALAFCACAPGSSSGGIATGPMHGPELVPNEYSQAIIRNSLTIVSRKAEMDGCRVKYPYVCNANMELLNISIHSAVTEFVADCETEGASIECTVEFNRYGLLSLLAVCTLPNGKTVNTDAMNFDCDTGRRVCLSDCFGSSDTDCFGKLTKLLAKSIEDSGYTVIGGEPVIDDSTLFLFAYDGLFLVFREYELFSYDAGAPRIKIRLASIAENIAADGLLNRLK